MLCLVRSRRHSRCCCISWVLTSVWSIDPPELIGRCRRNPSDPKNSWVPIDSVVWHPHSGELLGLYAHSDCVFKWHPYNGTHQDIYVGASTIAWSPEGSFFATGNGNRTIKLYNFEDFALVYQPFCKNFGKNTLSDISFSPDSWRLYGLHWQFCNVWAPIALLRLDEVDEQECNSEMGSDLSSSLPTTSISEAVAEIRNQITQ